MKYKVTIMLILMFMLISIVSASDIVEDVEFMPDKFVFEYNDHNSTTYEGDSGLRVAYVNNTLDNNTYCIPTEYVRGLAYATKGTFKFDEPIYCDHGPRRDWDGLYIATKFSFKNGTVIPYLGIEKGDLTNEQKKYFDNYQEQRNEYLLKEQAYAAENLYDYELITNRHKSKYSYYYGSGGSGVIYNP